MQYMLIAATTLTALAIGTSAQAALIASDGFEEATARDDLKNGAGTGSGWNGPWVFHGGSQSNFDLVDRSMSYSNGQVQVSGGQKALKLVPGVSTIHQPFTRALPTQTDTVYMSFLLHAPTATPIDNNDTQSANDDFFQFGFMNSTENPTASGGIQSKGGDTGGQQFLFSRYGTQGAVFANQSVNTETDYFLILKISKVNSSATYNAVQLFINPFSNVETEQTTVLSSFGETGLSSITQWVFRVARTDLDDAFYMDEFRLGTDFASVVPIPEPATLSLVGIAGLALLRRRREC